MKAVVVLNGEPPAAERFRELAGDLPVYAADGGSTICVAVGVRPEWVAGDLDSTVVKTLPPDWEIHHHPEQTRTDFQKVIGDLPEAVTEIVVLGGLGGRVDHLVTNLMLAAAFSPELQITFEHGDERIQRITPDCPYTGSHPIGAPLSLLPVAEAQGVTTSGLRWELHDATMRVGGVVGQSNEVTGPVSITLRSGSLFVWSDKKKSAPVIHDH